MESVENFKIKCLVTESCSTQQLRPGHGFSYLISVNNKNIIMDIGSQLQMLIYNMRIMKLTFKEIDFFFLSRGHHKHLYTLADLWAKKEIKEQEVREKLIDLSSPYSKIHQLLLKTKESKKLEPKHKEQITKTVSNLETPDKPSEITDGVMISGTMPPKYRNDIALCINIAGKGLVIVTGYAHLGILTVIEDAKRITGEDKIYGLIGGGFNLKGISKTDLQKTADIIQKENINFIYTTHPASYESLKTLTTNPNTKIFKAGQELIIK